VRRRESGVGALISLRTVGIRLDSDSWLQLARNYRYTMWSYRNTVPYIVQLSAGSEVLRAFRQSFLSSLVTLSNLSECSDPRDKIYALYGLLSKHVDQLPEVDYAVNPGELYESFTRAAITWTTKFWLPLVDDQIMNSKSDTIMGSQHASSQQTR
jgi:hypothetical protein